MKKNAAPTVLDVWCLYGLGICILISFCTADLNACLTNPAFRMEFTI